MEFLNYICSQRLNIMDSFKKEVLGNKYLHILEITNSFRVFVMDKCSFAMSQSLPIPTKKSNKSSAM